MFVAIFSPQPAAIGPFFVMGSCPANVCAFFFVFLCMLSQCGVIGLLGTTFFLLLRMKWQGEHEHDENVRMCYKA